MGDLAFYAGELEYTSGTATSRADDQQIQEAVDRLTAAGYQASGNSSVDPFLAVVISGPDEVDKVLGIVGPLPYSNYEVT
jgi:hypothetical protein